MPLGRTLHVTDQMLANLCSARVRQPPKPFRIIRAQRGAGASGFVRGNKNILERLWHIMELVFSIFTNSMSRVLGVWFKLKRAQITTIYFSELCVCKLYPLPR